MTPDEAPLTLREKIITKGAAVATAIVVVALFAIF